VRRFSQRGHIQTLFDWFCSWFSLKGFLFGYKQTLFDWFMIRFSIKDFLFGHIENIFYLLIPGFENIDENVSEMGFFDDFFLNGGWVGRLRRPCALVLTKRSYTNIIRFIHGWFSSKGFLFVYVQWYYWNYKIWFIIWSHRNIPPEGGDTTSHLIWILLLVSQ